MQSYEYRCTLAGTWIPVDAHSYIHTQRHTLYTCKHRHVLTYISALPYSRVVHQHDECTVRGGGRAGTACCRTQPHEADRRNLGDRRTRRRKYRYVRCCHLSTLMEQNCQSCVHVRFLSEHTRFTLLQTTPVHIPTMYTTLVRRHYRDWHDSHYLHGIHHVGHTLCIMDFRIDLDADDVDIGIFAVETYLDLLEDKHKVLPDLMLQIIR